MNLIHNQLKNTAIKAIIFDLGAVILNIDYNITKREFERVGVQNFDDLFSKAKQNQLFDNFEKGLISNDVFRNELRNLSGIKLSDAQIDANWNAMLLELPMKRFEMLQQLSKVYPLYLLSNTNKIHEVAFVRYIEELVGWNNFNSLFKKIYLSHQINLRKPDIEIFEKVITDNQLNPSTTLFIDDSPQHVAGALKAGLVAFHLTDGVDICDLFA